MLLGNKTVFVVGSLLGAVVLACSPSESSGECSVNKPCENRGEACEFFTNTCELQNLDVEATAEGSAPASFSNVALPFFRGRVCMPTRVQPGDTVPVKILPCLHSQVMAGGFTFKKQYQCIGSTCDAAVLQYYGQAACEDCPPNTFGQFERSLCQWGEIQASAGPFIIDGNAVRGNANVEVPFLTNDDAAQIRDGASVADIWTLIQQYPQASDRVWSLSMDGANPAAPANCDDESLCECRDIGF